MNRALDIALQGWGQVAPNPMVGAVAVRNGVVVGEGYHPVWGGPHAEVVALEAAGERAKGATLYVTLEPCNHEGKTGPCTRAIVEAGIARVVCGASEPHPVAGGGGAWLSDHGVEVELGVCETEANDLIAIHRGASDPGRPFVSLKYAMSLDARLSQIAGKPSEVTDGQAIVEAHRLRAGHDAVMVGIGTVLADDPRLTVRKCAAPRVPPVRIVLDADLRTPPDSVLVGTAADVPVWVFAAEDASAQLASRLEEKGAVVQRAQRASATGGLELGSVFALLQEQGIQSLLCEGGGILGSALLAARSVDRLYLLIAPKLFGEAGTRAFQMEEDLAVQDWRLIERRELGAITLLALSPETSRT